MRKLSNISVTRIASYKIDIRTGSNSWVYLRPDANFQKSLCSSCEIGKLQKKVFNDRPDSVSTVAKSYYEKNEKATSFKIPYSENTPETLNVSRQ